MVLSMPNIYSGYISFNIANIEYNLKKLGGVEDVKLKRWKVHINYHSSKVSVDEIKKTIDQTGHIIAEQD
ncbi:MAG: heavy-metal-associated domain-containing protein [Nitrososphaerales archaeon]